MGHAHSRAFLQFCERAGWRPSGTSVVGSGTAGRRGGRSALAGRTLGGAAAHFVYRYDERSCRERHRATWIQLVAIGCGACDGRFLPGSLVETVCRCPGVAWRGAVVLLLLGLGYRLARGCRRRGGEGGRPPTLALRACGGRPRLARPGLCLDCRCRGIGFPRLRGG